MSNKQIISACFKVNGEMVEEFARLTGDYNSMHINPEVARKSKYRRTVVHGMIPYSFIQVLQHRFQEHIVTFVSCSARFRKPVFIGDEIHLEISYESNEGKGLFEAVWTAKKSGEVLIKSSGKFSLEENNKVKVRDAECKSNAFIIDTIDEKQYLISDLSKQSESFKFLISRSKKHEYCEKNFK